MMKSCPYCGQIHEYNYICPKKPKKIKCNVQIRAFRNSSAWQHKREQIKQRDNYMCVACKRGLKGTVKRLNTEFLSVHHIFSLSEDFDRRFDDDNLVTLCALHHEMADEGLLTVEELSPQGEKCNF